MRPFQLEYRNSFEFGKEIRCIDNDTIVYCSSVGGIIQNCATGSRQLLECSEFGAQFAAVDVSSKGLVFLERPKNTNGFCRISFINIEDFDDRKVFDFEQCDAESARLCSIHVDGVSYAIILSEILLVITADGERINESPLPDLPGGHGTNCLSMSFYSIDNLLCIHGTASFWVYRFDKGELHHAWSLPDKDLSGIEGDLLHHCWVKDIKETAIFWSSCGRLLSFEAGTQHNVVHHLVHDVIHLSGIIKGFIAGCADGTLHLYFKNGTGDTFTHDRSLMLPGIATHPKTSSTLSMSILRNGKNGFVHTSEPKVLYRFNLDQVTGDALERIAFAHSGQVDLIETCIQMPLMVSSGTDKIVCLSNYVSGEQITWKSFADSPLAMSLHPSGKHLLIAFPDEVQCAHILIDEFRTFWRMPMSCRICKFSEGGHQFALSYDSIIAIFDTISGEKVQELKGHNSKVHSLVWAKADTNIISCDNGIIYLWDMSTGHRIRECVRYKSFVDIRFILTSPDEMWVFANDRVESLSSETFKIQETITETCNRKAGDTIVASHTTSPFCIASSGSPPVTCSSAPSCIRVYDAISKGFVDVPVTEKVTSMALSFDDKILIVGFASGRIIIYNLLDLRGSSALFTEGPQVERSAIDRCGVTMLVSDIFLQEKESIITDLRTTLKEVENHHAYRLGIRNISNEEEIFRLNEDLKKRTEVGSSAVQALKDQTSNMQRHHYIESRSAKDAFQAEMYNLENSFKKEMHRLKQATCDSTQKLTYRIQGLQLEKSNIVGRNRESMSSAAATFEQRLEEQHGFCKKYQHDLMKTTCEQKQLISEIEEEVDTQIENTKKKYKEMLIVAREKTLKASSENGIMHKRFISLKRSIEDQKETIKILLSREEDMREQIKEVEHLISAMHEMNRLKINTKKAKMAVIMRLTRQHQELEKFKYILDENLNELNNSLVNGVEVADVQAEIEKQRGSARKLRSENADIEKFVAYTGVNVKNMQIEISKRQKMQSALTWKYSFLLKGLRNCLDNIQNPNELSKQMAKLDAFKQTKSSERSEATEEEHGKSNELLILLRDKQAKLESVQLKSQEKVSFHRKQNQELLNEISRMKKELHFLRSQTKTFADKNRET